MAWNDVCTHTQSLQNKFLRCNFPQGREVAAFFFFFNLFIWLPWVFVAAHGPSLVAASGGYSVAVHGPLIVVASLVAEHGL